MENLFQQNMARVNRRQLFGSAASGVGVAALASLLGGNALADQSSPTPGAKGLPDLPHHLAKAKRVVLLWQGGGPSHVDLFDHKPTLQEMVGKDIPDSIRGSTRLSTMSSGYGKWPCVPAIKPFQNYGQSGIPLSSMLPKIGGVADEMTLVKSMHTEAVNHAPGVTFFLTGSQVPGRPSMGSWLSYGLGSESDNLPSFVVMTSSDKSKTCGQLFFDYYWGSGFLPSRFQGVRFRNTGDLVPYLANPPGVSPTARRALLDDIATMNAEHLADYGDPEIDTRIAQYEMAFRMQTSVPDLIDFSKESASTIERYGPDALVKGTFGELSLVGPRLATAIQPNRMVATILAGPLVGGWREVASRKEMCTVQPTTMGGTSLKIQCMCMICKPPFCISAGSTTRGSRTDFKVANFGCQTCTVKSSRA